MPKREPWRSKPQPDSPKRSAAAKSGAASTSGASKRNSTSKRRDSNEQGLTAHSDESPKRFTRSTEKFGAKPNEKFNKFSERVNEKPNATLNRKSNAKPNSKLNAKPNSKPNLKPRKSLSDAESETGGVIRLNKFIALCGAASRRKADEMIETGEVSVNGAVITELGYKVDRHKDRVMVQGRLLREAERKVYILLHKPKDAITTNSDEQGRRTVIDVLGIKERVFPVGRLDRNTTGVLLLTNDGELTNRLMHPSYGVEKEYIASLSEKCSHESIAKLKAGLRLKDTGEKVQPCEAKILGDGYEVWLSIHEGKNHQVHRMFESLGYEVVKLQRVAYAGLVATGLRRGDWRYLSAAEIRHLQTLSKPSKAKPKVQQEA